MTTTKDNQDFEAMAQALQANPAYRVLRHFSGTELFGQAVPPDAGIAVVLDTETTGRSAEDKIIELGLVRFAYNRETGEIYGALDKFNALEDPKMPIPPEATAVNGITDEMVAGKSIDDQAVQAFVAGADFIVAHNAGFDRPYCEARFPFMAALPWACSYVQVDWSAEGISSAKLEFIAYKQGFFFEAHRAEMDCLALLQALKVPFESGTRPLAQLLSNHEPASCRIWATFAPFEAKEVLKGRGYRWSDGLRPGTEKAWFKEVPAGDAFEQEMLFLKTEVFRGRPTSLPVDFVNSYSRFSGRRGETTRISR